MVEPDLWWDYTKYYCTLLCNAGVEDGFSRKKVKAFTLAPTNNITIDWIGAGALLRALLHVNLAFHSHIKKAEERLTLMSKQQ